jgi:membrane protein implicated in regulation of membrane protease activity
MVLIAIICPGLSFLLRGKILSAIVAIILQVVAVLTSLLFGAGFFLWLILAIWAVVSLTQSREDRRNRRLVRALRDR